MNREAETRLMEAIFPDQIGPRLRRKVNGVTLHDALMSALDDIARLSTPRSAQRVKKVIRLRFGFGGKCLTLKRVGEEFGVTGERIHQIEAKALRRLRHPSRSQVLRQYIIKDSQETDPEIRAFVG